MAQLDTSFLVPCKHCADLIQEGERFCPTCGKDQTIAVETKSPQSAFEDAFGKAPSVSGFDTGVGMVRPDTLWRAESLRGAAQPPWRERTEPSKRWLLGSAAALAVVLVLALVYYAFFARPAERVGAGVFGPLRDVSGKLDQAPAAVLRSADAPAASSSPDAGSARPPSPAAATPPRPVEPIDKACNDAMAALALCRPR